MLKRDLRLRARLQLGPEATQVVYDFPIGGLGKTRLELPTRNSRVMCLRFRRYPVARAPRPPLHLEFSEYRGVLISAAGQVG